MHWRRVSPAGRAGSGGGGASAAREQATSPLSPVSPHHYVLYVLGAKGDRLWILPGLIRKPRISPGHRSGLRESQGCRQQQRTRLLEWYIREPAHAERGLPQTVEVLIRVPIVPHTFRA